MTAKRPSFLFAGTLGVGVTLMSYGGRQKVTASEFREAVSSISQSALIAGIETFNYYAEAAAVFSAATHTVADIGSEVLERK